MDEKAGRMKAKELNLVVVGTVGILLYAKQSGLVPFVGPVLKTLREELHFFLSDRVFAEALRSANETEA